MKYRPKLNWLERHSTLWISYFGRLWAFGAYDIKAYKFRFLYTNKSFSF